MANDVRFAWTWAKGYAKSVYDNDTNLWSVTAGTIDTVATVMPAPIGAPSSGSPNMLRIQDANSIQAAVDSHQIGVFNGWFTWNGDETGVVQTVLALADGATIRVEVEAVTNAATSTQLKLKVGTTTVGTTALAYGATATRLAVGYDLTQTPPEACLYVNGTAVLGTLSSMLGGAGGPTSINNIQLHSGARTSGTHYGYWGDIVLFSDLAVENVGEIWVSYFEPNADSVDGSYSPSTGTDHYAVLDDASVATYVESSTDPDSFRVGMEERADRDAGLTLGAGVYAYCIAALASGDGALATVDFGLRSGSTDDTTDNQAAPTANPAFLYHVSAVDPDTAAAWTGGGIDAIEALVSVPGTP